MRDSGMDDLLTGRLREFVRNNNIHPDPHFAVYSNGIYAVLDCVFSAMARWEPTVKPMVERFAVYAWQKEIRTFSDFVADVDQFGADRFEKYAAEVLKNRGVLSKRRKAEVAYEVACFFVENGIETTANFHCLEIEEAEELVLDRLVKRVSGIGSVLANYLMWLLGREDYVKVDTLLNRLFGTLSDWQPRNGNAEDMKIIRRAITTVAREMKTTPAQLDNALWKYESGGRKPLVWATTPLVWGAKD